MTLIRQQQRRGTASFWAAINPVLAAGEIGFISDNSPAFKIGDGTTAWNDLPQSAISLEDLETSTLAAQAAQEAAEAAAAQAVDISNIDTSDGVVSFLVTDPDSDTATALAASIVQGAGYARLNLVIDGDSNLAGGNGIVPPQYRIHRLLAEGIANCTATNVAVSGQTITAMIADAATQIDTLIDNSPGVLNLLIVGGGGNDLDEGAHPSAATVYARKVAYHQARRAAGWTTIELTVLPRSLASSWGAGYETNRAALNNMIRADHSYADGLADSDQDPVLATVASTANDRYWPGITSTTDGGLHIGANGMSHYVAQIRPEIARLGALTGQRQNTVLRPTGSFFVPASAFVPATGGTMPTNANPPLVSWVYPAGSARTVVVASIDLPKSWRRVTLYPTGVTFGGTTTGSVAHFMVLTPIAVDTAFQTGNYPAFGPVSTTPNAPARHRSNGSSALPSVDALTWNLSYERQVSDTTHDTLAGDWSFLGVEVVDATNDAD